MTVDKNLNSDLYQMDEALKSALRRREAPDAFADQILARVARQNSVRQLSRDPWWRIFAQPLIRRAAVSATAVSLVIGGVYYHNVQRERAEGEAAKQQLMLALRIAGSKLQLAKAKVNEINATHPTNPSRNEGVKE